MAALPKGWTTGEPTVHPATVGDRTTRNVVPIRDRVSNRYGKVRLALFLESHISDLNTDCVK